MMALLQISLFYEHAMGSQSITIPSPDQCHCRKLSSKLHKISIHIASVSSEGPGESVHTLLMAYLKAVKALASLCVCRLTRAFAANILLHETQM